MPSLEQAFALAGDNALEATEAIVKLSGAVQRLDQRVLAEDLQQIAADLKADVETTDLAAPPPATAVESGRSSAINRSTTRTWTP